jgi:hypothetical protein
MYADRSQQPLREPPTISVRLAEPPSEVGTGGGQIELDEWLEAAAVEVAACVEVLGVSPGICNGTWELFDDGALIPEALLLVPEVLLLPDTLLPPDPVAVTDPLAVPAGADPPEKDDPVGNDDVGTLSEPEPMPSPLVDIVWAWAVVMPKTVTAIRKMCRIALSPAFVSPAAIGDNARTSNNEDEV